MFARVIPARRTPLKLAFLDYSVPKKLKKKIRIGQLVSVPLRSKLEFGVVKEILLKSHLNKTRDIKEIVLLQPVLAPEQLNFLQELSDLYNAPLSFLLSLALLPLQKTKILQLAKLTKKKQTSKKLKKQSKPVVCWYNNLSDKKILINQIANKKGQTLFLVAEKVDCNSLLNLLSKQARNKALVYNSNLSTKEKFTAWVKIWLREKEIVIGTRAALFLPFFNLKSIFFDDDSNPNHKSWDMAPRFHTRDAALLLAKHYKPKIYLSGHTPAVETYFFSSKNVYQTKNTTKPIGSPNIIDLAKERRNGNLSSLSFQLEQQISKSNGDIFLFLNHKYSMNHISCRDCGFIWKCNNCKRGLATNDETKNLVCKFCKSVKPLPLTCDNCHGANISSYGVGTAGLTKEINRLYGKTHQITRLDSDFEQPPALSALPTITIGTELAWSKLNWSKLDLMCFINADLSLFIPEYKIAEYLWQNLRAAAYRMPQNSQLLVQTFHPEHLVFSSLTSPSKFYAYELNERKLFGYPPYNYLLKLFYGATNMALAQEQASLVLQTLKRLTQGNADIKITPNIEMSPRYAKGKYWQIILVKLNYRNYKQGIKAIVPKLPSGWKVDPNPNTILSL